jgi:hypothetical protein
MNCPDRKGNKSISNPQTTSILSMPFHHERYYSTVVPKQAGREPEVLTSFLWKKSASQKFPEPQLSLASFKLIKLKGKFDSI